MTRTREIMDRPLRRKSFTQGMLHPIALSATIFAQVFFTSLFVLKTGADLFNLQLAFLPWSAVELVELLASVGMLLGVISSVLLVRESARRMRQVSDRVNAASGELHQYLETQFTEWNLTPTEKAVALYIVKGFSNQEIANLRGTTESTVKSQISSIFRKSDVSNRQQLVSWVIEDLITGIDPECEDDQGRTVTA